MTMKHTAEPWQTNPTEGWNMTAISQAGRMQQFAVSLGFGEHNHKANGQRIVDCVNGCAGINPEALGDAFRHLEKIHMEINGMHCTKRDLDLDYAQSSYGKSMDDLIRENAILLKRIQS